ncbi:putative GCN5-related N-acetyltransferase [Magnetofaba australis IT-1]|uniref:Putative GCN5-related N-acetyltransferase n=1 Tax=Magnetofaba australis IT-1 TaxID=1434232 RepID=A0A1Y2K2W9_9PROT|nr:putative GCN5-related N-acetyltransferase [Magnetofaba australis IT-1]
MLADALRAQGALCCFHLDEANCREMAAQRGHEVSTCLTDITAPPAADLLIGDAKWIDWGISEAWARSGRFAARLIIDDMGNRPVTADLLLNHNIYGAAVDYAHYRAPEILSGPRHSLIDAQWLALRETPRAQPRALISFGATDDGSKGAAVAKLLLARAPDLRLDLIIAPVARPAPAVQQQLEDMTRDWPHRLTVWRGADMRQRMADATLYVGAAGVTALEATAAGLNLVLCGHGDDQDINIAAFSQLGVSADTGFDPERMAAATQRAMTAPQPPALAHALDGLGPQRVAARLMQLCDDRE